MATTGSSSSISTPDVARAATTVVIGLATHNDATTAAAVLGEVQSAVAAMAPAIACRLAVADGGSTDGTVERLRQTVGPTGELLEAAYALQPSDRLHVPYHGQPGRARALRALLHAARDQHADACLVVDRRSAIAAGAWVRAVLPGIGRHDLDFVAPVYDRHPGTAGLVHGLVYPVFRALYGARVRDPIGAHVACSSRFIDAVVDDPIWDSDAGQVGIDLWLTAEAVTGQFRIGQASIPSPEHEERGGADLSATLAQVIGAVFMDIERRVRVWQRVRGSRPVPRMGTAMACQQPPAVQVGGFADAFRAGYRDLHDVWAEVLPPLAILQWRRIAVTPLDAFRVDDALWARTIYDFAMGYRLRVIARDHLLRSLTPLYLAWLASFVQELAHSPSDAAEDRLERLCLAFEAEKPYLVSQWRWPERFKPAKLRR